MPAFDPAAAWTDGDAIGRVCSLLDTSGRRAASKRIASIAGSVTCPQCGEAFIALDEPLQPTDF